MAIGSRAQIFGSDKRCLEHLLIAAKADHIRALLAVGEGYLYGHMGLTVDREAARPWLERASELGNEKANKLLKDKYHYPEG